MITQDERDKLKQWYADYKETESLTNEGVSNPQNWDYQDWLEYMLTHRSSLLQQSAEYADSLEAALKLVYDYLRDKRELSILELATLIDRIEKMGVLESEAE